jgi:hypothetical protein
MKSGALDFTAADKAALRQAIRDRLAQEATEAGLQAETSTRANLTNSRIE